MPEPRFLSRSPRATPLALRDDSDEWALRNTVCSVCNARIAVVGDAEGEFFEVERRHVYVAVRVPGLPGYVQTSGLKLHTHRRRLPRVHK